LKMGPKSYAKFCEIPMNRQRRLPREAETEKLELKRSTSEPKEAVISVASILNKHHKGKLCFGVRNDGTVLGQDVSEQTLRDVSRALSERIEPRIYPKVERVKLSGRDCVRVIFAGQDVPYFAFGRACVRVAEEDRQLSARELERMFLRRNSDHEPWESEVSERRLSDVHVPTLRQVIRRAEEVFGNFENFFAQLKIGKLLVIKISSRRI